MMSPHPATSARIAPAPVPATLRRARVSTSVCFAIIGIALSMWLVNIPAVRQRTQISNASLGSAILLFGVGAVIAMQLSGLLIERWGSRAICGAGIALVGAAAVLPGLATGPVSLSCALFVFGVGKGTLDVGANDQAVLIENRYGRPIMSAFHGYFSVGTAAGAAAGGAAQLLQLNLVPVLMISGALVLALGVGSVPSLVSHDPAGRLTHRPIAADAAQPTNTDPATERRRVIGLALLAFILLLCEGAANDWSALQAIERFGVPESAASIAFFTFSAAMMIGRFTADRVTRSIGATRVVRLGTTCGATGIGLVIVSNSYPLTLLGWAIFGLGLAGAVPQIYTAAGNATSRRQAVALSRVVSAGYLGLLAGPAVIGWVSDATGLTTALAIPLILCLTAVLAAGVVNPHHRLPPRTRPAHDAVTRKALTGLRSRKHLSLLRSTAAQRPAEPEPVNAVTVTAWAHPPTPPPKHTPTAIHPVWKDAPMMELYPGEPPAGPWRRASIAELLTLLGFLNTTANAAPLTRIVAVDGRGGAGKTTLTERLEAAVPGSVTVHTDDIAWNHSVFDWADLLVEEVLAPARRGRAVDYTPPGWLRHGRLGTVAVPAGVPAIWVEGCGSARRELRDHIDAAIWLQSDRTTAEQRLIERDGAEKTRNDLAEWLPEELPFYLDQRPWHTVDVIVAATPVLDHDTHTEVVLAPPVPT